jgi:hypothetical protein
VSRGFGGGWVGVREAEGWSYWNAILGGCVGAYVVGLGGGDWGGGCGFFGNCGDVVFGSRGITVFSERKCICTNFSLKSGWRGSGR